MSQAPTGLPDPTKIPIDTTTPEGVAEQTVKTLMANPGQIPQKFKDAAGVVNVDLLMASYLELERQRTAQADSSDAAAETPAASSTSSTPDLLAKSSTSTSADSLADAIADPKQPEGKTLWAQVEAELAETGTLSTTTIAGMRAEGMSDAQIISHVSGHKALQKDNMAAAAEMVGGQEQLDLTTAWAQKTLTTEEKAAIEPLLRGEAAATVLMGLHQRRLAAEAGSGQVNTGNIAGGVLPPGDPNRNLTAFRDWPEQQAAMRDPRYKTDPDYRAICEARLMIGAGYEIQR